MERTSTKPKAMVCKYDSRNAIMFLSLKKLLMDIYGCT